MDTKRCPRCGQTKPITDFGSHKSYCRPCHNAYGAEWRRANPDRRREQKRKADQRFREANPTFMRAVTLKRYGLTFETFDALLAAQDGKCAICRCDEPGGKHNTWHVDHDHRCCAYGTGSCGRCIRGLLCSRCNVGLGQFRDNPELLAKAISYLTTSALV